MRRVELVENGQALGVFGVLVDADRARRGRFLIRIEATGQIVTRSSIDFVRLNTEPAQ